MSTTGEMTAPPQGAQFAAYTGGVPAFRWSVFGAGVAAAAVEVTTVAGCSDLMLFSCSVLHKLHSPVFLTKAFASFFFLPFGSVYRAPARPRVHFELAHIPAGVSRVAILATTTFFVFASSREYDFVVCGS